MLHVQDPQGSRFQVRCSVGWQQAAPGNVSTRCSSIGHRIHADAIGKTFRWVIPGSRLLPSDRTAAFKAAPLRVLGSSARD